MRCEPFQSSLFYQKHVRILRLLPLVSRPLDFLHRKVGHVGSSQFGWIFHNLSFALDEATHAEPAPLVNRLAVETEAGNAFCQDLWSCLLKMNWTFQHDLGMSIFEIRIILEHSSCVKSPLLH